MAGIHQARRLSTGTNEGNCLNLNTLYQQDIISVSDLTLSEINLILDTAKNFKENPRQKTLKDKLIASCFFEPSTRTRLSFDSAVYQLGGNVTGFSAADSTSTKKGESLKDSMRIVDDYADLVIIRHPREGAARLAADVCQKPVINAGDGANQHPTQTLVDLFTINECQQSLQGLSIALVGDLKFGRTVHSLIQACRYFDTRLFLVSPEELTLPESIFDELRQAGVRYSFHQSIEEVIPKVDILYMTRTQHERVQKEEVRLGQQYVLTAEKLKKAKPNLKVLHPLPRIDEIDDEVDSLPQAYYFQQAANGVFVRQALLTLMLNKELS